MHFQAAAKVRGEVQAAEETAGKAQAELLATQEATLSLKQVRERGGVVGMHSSLQGILGVYFA